VFTSGGVAFGFDAMHARHVLRGDACESQVRFLEQWYPVLDLRREFGHRAASGSGFVLLVESGERAGLRVDELRGLCRIDPAALAPLPAVYRGPERRWIAGLAPTDDAVVVVVRIAGLLQTFLPRERIGAVQ
jgi:chemotaxis signal transduction protein